MTRQLSPRKPYEPDRTKFPRSEKARRFFANERGWLCACGCGQDVHGGFEIDHILARELGGDDDWVNLRLLAVKCHRAVRTPADRKLIAKSDSVRARHDGTKAPPKRPLPGSRASGWKQKVGGGWVRRDA